MRPDEHKAKDSRRYQARKKQQGDSTAADVARKRADKSRDKGVGIAAIRRRNGEEETEEEKEERKAIQAQFSRRKMTSNYDRYIEETEEDRLEKDIELGIDRETTDLVAMLENTDRGNPTFFKFKDEQLFGEEQKQNIQKNMLQLDFQSFAAIFDKTSTQQLLELVDSDQLIEDALDCQPVTLDKPIVPGFAKNAKGYIVHKSQQPSSVSVPETDGIYLRNDGSNHKTAFKPPAHISVKAYPKSNYKDTLTADDLDELLAMDPVKEAPIRRAVLPKPEFIKNKPTAHEESKDDEAWLDDLLEE
ncbi:hypothetical protein BY458DRAFT_492512 [Sporodiniella umbellata]|nr:hypothetical protein BY458DRAFT_492512 [Sporodiniella umbellata]